MCTHQIGTSAKGNTKENAKHTWNQSTQKRYEMKFTKHNKLTKIQGLKLKVATIACICKNFKFIWWKSFFILCQHLLMVTRLTTNQKTWKHLRQCKFNGITQWNPRPTTNNYFILKESLKDFEHWSKRKTSDELYLEWKLWWQGALVWRNLVAIVHFKPLLNLGDIKPQTPKATSDLNVDNGSNGYIVWWQWTST
jgi:hypothetical protein